MPRDLGDVLDFFLPEGEARDPAPPDAPGTAMSTPTPSPQPPLSIIALPMDGGDVLRAALAWNLAVEIARLGGRAAVVTRKDAQTSPIWPEAGRGPLGAELIQAETNHVEGLLEAATDASRSEPGGESDAGVVLLCAPLAWLRGPSGLAPGLDWALLFSRTEPRELLEAYALTKALLQRADPPRVGLTIHGAASIDAARAAFSKVADVAHRHLGRSPVSYGLLVDDLHVYRAIVARRPIGLEHPQSPAARAMRDVARLLLTDARNDSRE